VQGDDEASNHELSIPRPSKYRRIRSSMVQFFKGSFWSPPESTKRVRRPPSQWWSPTSSLNTSNRKPNKSSVVDAEAYPTMKLSDRKISGSEGMEENKVSIVRKVPSSEIYDFSD